MIQDTLPTRRDVWLVGVLPTGVALLVTAFLMVEGLQTDSLLQDQFSPPAVWMSFLIAFGFMHIWGATALAGGTPSVGSRLTRIATGAVFLAALAPGALGCLALVKNFILFPLALAFRIDGSLELYQQSLVFHVIVWAFSVLVLGAPGAAFGALLALAAGPRWRRMSRADWKRLLMAYAASGLVAVLIEEQMSERLLSYWFHGERNPLFDSANALAGALIAYVGVILACGCVWMAAFQVYARSGNVLKSRECWLGLAKLFVFALPLAAATHLMAANGVIFLGDNLDKSNRIANYVRSGRQTLSPRKLEFQGLLYVGPPGVLKHQWEQLILQSKEWKRRPQGYGRFDDEIKIRQTNSGDNRPPDCRALAATRAVCADLARANLDISGLRANITVNAYDSSIPEAALIYQLSGPYDAPATLVDLQAPKSFDCYLHLVGVPADGLTTEAATGCVNWPIEAQRLKALVSSWFAKAQQ